MAKILGETGQQYLGLLYRILDKLMNALGDFPQALLHYKNAPKLAIAQNETLILPGWKLNIAIYSQAQGHYRGALTLLNSALQRFTEESPFEVAMTQFHMVECYLSLNRYTEARELARRVIEDCRSFNASYELARTLMFLATLEAKIGNFPVAEAALSEAEPIFASRGATSWMATIRLWRGRMALKQGNPALAYQESAAAAAAFAADDQQVNDAMATLLRGQSLFALRDYPASETAGNKLPLRPAL